MKQESNRRWLQREENFASSQLPVNRLGEHSTGSFL